MYVGSGHLRTCNTKQKKNTFNDSAQQDKPLYGSGKNSILSFITIKNDLVSRNFAFWTYFVMVFDRKKQNLKTFKPFFSP